MRLLTSLAALSFALPQALAGPPKSCASPLQLSCQANAPAPVNDCCVNYPAGSFIFNQAWNSNGPKNVWTVGGLYPSKCNGIVDVSYCDPNRTYDNITTTLQSFGKNALLKDMRTYWSGYPGSNDPGWESDWNYHGACISTLFPKCYQYYKSGEEVAPYFARGIELTKAVKTYDYLAAAGITPSDCKYYTLKQLKDAIQAKHGKQVGLLCNGDILSGTYYWYAMRGPFQSGKWVRTDAPDGGLDTCPTVNIRYLAKGSDGVCPTPGNLFTGNGTLTVTHTYPNGTNKVEGCLDGDGKWAVASNCTTFTAQPAQESGTFTLSSKYGSCVWYKGFFGCNGQSGPSTFYNSNGKLSTNGQSTQFFTFDVPTKTQDQQIYLSSHDVFITIGWKSV